jgi:hypothetical protein
VCDLGEDRYDRFVGELKADGLSVFEAGANVGHLSDWPDIKMRAQSPKLNWCTEEQN